MEKMGRKQRENDPKGMRLEARRPAGRLLK